MAEKTHRTDYEKYIRDLAEFMDSNGCKLRPFPKVRISNRKQDGVFIRTAYYDPEKKEITLFVKGRHLKDILRSCAHENVHHHQNLEGRLKNYSGDTLGQDEELDMLESEAYEQGNVLFRKWTETKTKSEKPEKTFSKHMKKKISMDEAAKFGWGKYKGEDIGKVIRENPDYCLWLVNNLDHCPFTYKQLAMLDAEYFHKHGLFPLKCTQTPKYVFLNGKQVAKMSKTELQELWGTNNEELRWLVKQVHKNNAPYHHNYMDRGAPAFQSDDVGDIAWMNNEDLIRDIARETITEFLINKKEELI